MACATTGIDLTMPVVQAVNAVSSSTPRPARRARMVGASSSKESTNGAAIRMPAKT